MIAWLKWLWRWRGVDPLSRDGVVPLDLLVNRVRADDE